VKAPILIEEEEDKEVALETYCLSVFLFATERKSKSTCFCSFLAPFYLTLRNGAGTTAFRL
jgi:hypothetical protein